MLLCLSNFILMCLWAGYATRETRCANLHEKWLRVLLLIEATPPPSPPSSSQPCASTTHHMTATTGRLIDYTPPTHTHIRTHIPRGFWGEGGHIGSKWAKAMFFGVGTIPLESASFSMKRLLWHSRPAFDDFHDISCPPLKRANRLNDFTFDSFYDFLAAP